MSGFAGPDLQAEAQAAGAQGVLTKPLSAVELAQCVAGVLAAARAAAVRLTSIPERRGPARARGATCVP